MASPSSALLWPGFPLTTVEQLSTGGYAAPVLKLDYLRAAGKNTNNPKENIDKNLQQYGSAPANRDSCGLDRFEEKRQRCQGVDQ